MKFIDEYRDTVSVNQYAQAIRRTVTRPWTLMEICGGQTHAIVRFGLDALLPKEITLAHGPGCPVCVTPIEFIDKAIWGEDFPYYATPGCDTNFAINSLMGLLRC